MRNVAARQKSQLTTKTRNERKCILNLASNNDNDNDNHKTPTIIIIIIILINNNQLQKQPDKAPAEQPVLDQANQAVYY